MGLSKRSIPSPATDQSGGEHCPRRNLSMFRDFSSLIDIGFPCPRADDEVIGTADRHKDGQPSSLSQVSFSKSSPPRTNNVFIRLAAMRSNKSQQLPAKVIVTW